MNEFITRFSQKDPIAYDLLSFAAVWAISFAICCVVYGVSHYVCSKTRKNEK
jgi:hypothetical protein